jgi:glutaredoxin
MITIYGKPGCAMCDKAKEKLTEPFLFVDVSDLSFWRENNLVEFMVEKTMREDNGKPELPLLLIDGKFHDYPEAMAWLRKNSSPACSRH